MAIKGKKPYQLHLDQENVEFLRRHFETSGKSGGLSGFIDKYIKRIVVLIQSNEDVFDGIKPGKMTFKTFWQFCKLHIKLEKEELKKDVEDRKIFEKLSKRYNA